MVNKASVLKNPKGNKIIPRTVTQAVQDENGVKLNVLLENKLDKSKVVNNNTSLEIDGNVLNAVQANPNVDGTLAKQISVLNIERGYLISRTSIKDCNLMLENGKYVATETTLNIPTSGSFVVDVSKRGDIPNDLYLMQTATCHFGSKAGSVFTRERNNGVWGGWKQIATKDEIDTLNVEPSVIQLTGAQANITILSSSILKRNGWVSFYASFKKTDDTDFVGGSGLYVSSLGIPTGYKTKNTFTFINGDGATAELGIPTTYLNNGYIYLSNQGVYVKPSANCKVIRVQGMWYAGGGTL